MTVDDDVNVIASAAAAASSAVRVGRRRHGAVGLDDVDLPAPGPQAVGQHVAGDRGPGQEHPAAAGRSGPAGKASSSDSATNRSGTRSATTR